MFNSFRVLGPVHSEHFEYTQMAQIFIYHSPSASSFGKTAVPCWCRLECLEGVWGGGAGAVEGEGVRACPKTLPLWLACSFILHQVFSMMGPFRHFVSQTAL